MQQNYSMKDIRLKSRLFEDKLIQNDSSYSPKHKQFKFNIDSALKYITKVNYEDSAQKIKKYNLTARSHKKLNFNSTHANFDIKSPKQLDFHQTDRCLKQKNWDTIQISKFQHTDHNVKKQTDQQSFKQLFSPRNKISIVQNQPKRPKILNRKYIPTFFQQFKLGKVLGKGRFGNVFIAQNIQTKAIFAVKQISLQKVCPKLIQRLIWQIKIQFFAKHQNCLQLYKFYKQNNNIYLVIQLGEMSLFDLLRKKKYFNQRQVAYYIKQTIKAFQYLHQNGIIHRDLKPENIVLINNTVKLADFGWSIYIGQNDKRKTFCGTLDYVSPEIVLGSEYDEMVDVWSIGVLSYQLSTGHAPFESSKSRQETYRKIINIDLKFPKYMSQEIKDFISRLLIKNPKDRMSLQEALQHPWLRQYDKK